MFSPAFETHLECISSVLSVVRSAGLQLSSPKCHFGSRQITILHHIVDSSGVLPYSSKFRGVLDFPVSISPEDFRSFVGVFSYFGRFVRNFASIARTVTDLPKKGTPFSRALIKLQLSEALSSTEY